MTLKTWQFTAADSLFFGSGKPMNAGESSWIDSQFPPTGFTLQGAIRTAVLYCNDADIDAFVNGKPCLENNIGSLYTEIGDATSMGNLELTGPFLYDTDTLLFPVPLDLMSKGQQHALLKPNPTPIHCDLGNIRLPTIDAKGYKVSENCYIDHHDMAKLLNGDTTGIKLIPLFTDNPDDKNSLADKESKIGLARDNLTRNSVEGMLFAIAPVRPRQAVNLRMRVQGIEPNHLPQKAFLQKLGGEGKLASISVSDTDIHMPAAQITQDKDGVTICFKLVFTQPALMPVDGWLPESFKPSIEGWTGQLNNEQVTIVSACIGKPVNFGGWDLIKHSSKIHHAYIPAGSVYFCEALVQDQEHIKQLHDTKLGKNTEYGFGHVLVGRWEQ